MIKLECTNCKKIWFTANTEANQRCPECLCLLKEKDFNCIVNDETISSSIEICDIAANEKK